jgi:hypothetical protein
MSPGPDTYESFKCLQDLILMSHLNVSRSCAYDVINLRESCDLTEHNIRTALSSTPRSQNPHNPRTKVSPDSHKYPQGLDIDPQTSYSSSITPRRTLMSVAYLQGQKQRYRVTLELEVLSDFDPHNIDWEKVFQLEPAEKVSAYVEDLSTPDRW